MISETSVIGTGIMGKGISRLLALNNFKVAIYDSNSDFFFVDPDGHTVAIDEIDTVGDIIKNDSVKFEIQSLQLTCGPAAVDGQ